MNKEIVKKLKDSLECEFDLSFNERKELLSYIEQLENNRDKAIEYIENDLQISILPNNQIINGTEVVKRINKIEKILKGDSEWLKKSNNLKEYMKKPKILEEHNL